MSLTKAALQTRLYFGESADPSLRLYLKGKMNWICEASDYVLTVPITEPMNKPVFCTGCGRTHTLKPGELSAADKAAIERLKEIAASLHYNEDDYDEVPEVSFSDLSPKDLAYLQSA